MPYYCTTGALPLRRQTLTSFEFRRFRFHFQAIDSVYFPRGKSGNVIRGAFGLLLRATAPLEDYARIFEPGQENARPGPSGLADWPRPFVLRVAHLDAATIAPAGRFFVDVHLFDLREDALRHFRTAFAHLASQGLGPRRGRVELQFVERLNLEDHSEPVPSETGEAPEPLTLYLDPEKRPVRRILVQFLTPTELKTQGGIAERPDFPVLFARLRDRISTLRALYGAGPLEVDFQGMGRRAEEIRLSRCELIWEKRERRSGRTGQTHPLGGFTGLAEYQGSLAEFAPWLEAARWTGVGRQTVWGKGELRCLEVE
jgi:hypothetical protein